MKNILIAEDEKALANALSLKLTHAGFSVKVATDGSETLEMISKNKFDLILLDLVMPNLDGFAVLTEISARQSRVPVVVLSNLGQAEDEKRARELGAIDYWVKAQMSLVQIVAKIKNILGN